MALYSADHGHDIFPFLYEIYTLSGNCLVTKAAVHVILNLLNQIVAALTS